MKKVYFLLTFLRLEHKDFLLATDFLVLWGFLTSIFRLNLESGFFGCKALEDWRNIEYLLMLWCSLRWKLKIQLLLILLLFKTEKFLQYILLQHETKFYELNIWLIADEPFFVCAKRIKKLSLVSNDWILRIHDMKIKTTEKLIIGISLL